jgi:hypothetical protein
MKFRHLHTLLAAIVGAAALGLTLLIPAGAAAAESGPAWEVTQVTAPTNLVPGSDSSTNPFHEPVLRVYLTNVGDGVAAESATPIVITDTLPGGITVASGLKATVAVPVGAGNTKEPCDVSGQTVTCEVSLPVSAGGVVQILIPIAVDQSLAEPTVTNEVSVMGGGAPTASSRTVVSVGSTLPDFGFISEQGLSARAFDAAGGPPSLAGSHPFMVEVGAQLNSSVGSKGLVTPVQGLRNLKFDLPGGLVADPSAVPVRCTTAQLAAELEEVSKQIGEAGCPVESQVGVVYTEISGTGLERSPLYVMVPSPGHPAELAFSYVGVIGHLQGGLGGDLHLTAEASELVSKFPILGAHAFLWGVPSASGHDPQRAGQGCFSQFGCTVKPSQAPFLTMPSSCTEPMDLQGVATSWLGAAAEETRPLAGIDGESVHLTGCDSLAFEPTFEAKPTTEAAEQPTGLDVKIDQPQDESPEGRATATLKDAKVALPEGMVLNAAAGNGLAACTEEEIGYAPEGGKVRFSAAPQTCPSAARVGTLEAETPLLKGEVLPGSVYVAKPFDNPFGSLLAIYLAIESKKNGIYTKLAGEVETNPVTGQLSADFKENPQLPIEDIKVHFFGGANSTLTTPLTCGTKMTDASLTPWSTPEGADAQLSDSFQITSGCSSSEAAAPKTTSFSAGTASPLSGAYSPFVLRLSRPDGSQHITGVETTLPEGLLGKLAGVSYCPESGIAQAIGRERPEQGKLEQASPSCPASSEVGTVNVTAGSGSNPIPVSGHAYLAGPYKGAPLSLVVIVPAVAGPFDLGTVVDRVALNVGEYDAKIHAVADPLPTIRDGIPLDVRSIELKLDRPSFTLNPTSCEVMAIEGTATTQAGQSSALNNRFQVGECSRLKFSPKLSLSLSGATGRTGHPALKAVLTYPKGEYANIARAQVALPHAEFLNQSAIAGACTKTLLAAHACPKKSIYGKAKAWSPLLDKPLEGPVYLVGGYGYKLPAMVAELNGQIRLLLVGKVDTGKSGGIRNTFEAVPDAPVSKFVLQLHSGKKGLLENSENICEKPRKAGAAFTAQNGKVKQFAVKIANSCKSKKGKKHR